MALIDFINPDTRRIHLSIDTVDASWHPADLYREVRVLRRTDESLRRYDNFMSGAGNVDKGGGKATERYFVLLLGTRIVPYDSSHVIDVTGTIISDDGLEGVQVFDRSPLSSTSQVDIQYAPKQVEVINLNFDDLVYSSFQGAVWVDLASSYTDVGSSNFPNGNAERPVNSVQLAVTIAATRGFDHINLLSDVTLDTGDDIRGYTIQGKSSVTTTVIVNPGCLCLETQFIDLSISGTLDGDSVIEDCSVGDISFFSGVIKDSSISGDITLAGSVDAYLNNCAIANILNTPTIDCGGSGQNLVVTNYSGRITITNLTGASEVGLGLDAGDVIIDATCTAGIVAVSGTGAVLDNSGVGCYVINTTIDGTDLHNIKRSVESLRPHHPGSGITYYWDPYEGVDTRDGKHQSRAFKTFSAAHAACVSGEHDVIMCMSRDPAGVTTTNENITISKNSVLLRGSGKDFEIKSTDDNAPAITITGDDVEVSGMLVNTSLTSTVNAIYSTGDNTLIEHVQIDSAGDGIEISGATGSTLNRVKIRHNAGYGIKVTGAAKHIDIADCYVSSNGGAGITIGTIAGHEINLIGNNIIHGNTGYGIDIEATATEVIIGGGTDTFNNNAGDTRDLGTDTQDNRGGNGGGLTATEKAQIAMIPRLVNYNEGTWRIIGDQMIYYNTDGSEFMRFDLLDAGGQPTTRGALARVKV